MALSFTGNGIYCTDYSPLVHFNFRYFHTNFGFNLKLWDWMHDTLHKSDRIYGENIFYGKGKQPEKT